MRSWIADAHRLGLRAREVPAPYRYLVTVVLIAFATWIQVRLGGSLARYPFLIYIPIIFVCAGILDRGNGFLATVLASASCAYYLLAPTHSFDVADATDKVALFLFFIIGILISLVLEALHVGVIELAAGHEQLRQAARDRDLLLNELSHRTRNDLANVVTLLQLQSRSPTSSTETREALTSAADRVQTIARIHRRLDLFDNRVVVDSRAYISELCADLRLSRLAMRPIAIECTCESHLLSIEKAVPLGLIVNESVTNAVKHAFPDGRSGIIAVSFQRAGGRYRLTIRDNGVGTGATPRKDALGNRLMQLLAAQLDSKIEKHVGADGGTVVVVLMAIKTESDERLHGPDQRSA